MEDLLRKITISASDPSLERYFATVQEGRKIALKDRVVICGLARNLEAILPATLKRIDVLVAMFENYRVVIYENDSEDRTLNILREYQSENPKIHILSEDRDDPVNESTRCLKRAGRMAYYRNQYREYIAKNFADFDHVIVVDMDLPGAWCDSGIAHTFGNKDWDFVGSYGLLRKRGLFRERIFHYDAWAFRRDGNDEAIPTKEASAISWERGGSLEPVNSCFGGLGIYRMEAMLTCSYEGTDCEHVPFHRQMRENGMNRLYLNPNQITDYGVRYSRIIRKCKKWGNNFSSSTSTVLP